MSNISWDQLVKCEDVQLYLVIYDNKWRIFLVFNCWLDKISYSNVWHWDFWSCAEHFDCETIYRSIDVNIIGRFINLLMAWFQSCEPEPNPRNVSVFWAVRRLNNGLPSYGYLFALSLFAAFVVVVVILIVSGIVYLCAWWFLSHYFYSILLDITL